MVLPDRTKGYLYGLLTIVLWGLHPIITRYLATERGVDVINVGFLRLWGGALFLFLLMFFRYRNLQIFRTFRYSRMFFFGAIGFGANLMFFQMALGKTYATYTAIFENFAPIFVLIFGFWFASEHFTVSKRWVIIVKTLLLVVISSLASVLLFIHPENSVSIVVGNFQAFLSAVFFAMFLLSNGVVRKSSDSSSFVITANYLFFAGILFLPFINIANFAQLNVRDWLLVSVVVIFCTAIAYVSWSYAARFLSVMAQSILFNFVVVTTMLFDNLFLDFEITWKVIVAGIVILGCSYYAEKIHK